MPAPRQLTLERQLNKSVLISWTAPEGIGPGNHIESYHVYVDGVLKTTIKATERTRALVEGVDSNRVSAMNTSLVENLILLIDKGSYKGLQELLGRAYFASANFSISDDN